MMIDEGTLCQDCDYLLYTLHRHWLFIVRFHHSRDNLLRHVVLLIVSFTSRFSFTIVFIISTRQRQSPMLFFVHRWKQTSNRSANLSFCLLIDVDNGKRETFCTLTSYGDSFCWWRSWLGCRWFYWLCLEQFVTQYLTKVVFANMWLCIVHLSPSVDSSVCVVELCNAWLQRMDLPL